MKAVITAVLLALALPAVMSTDTSSPKLHTQCFNYFLNKDKCVHGAADASIRCKDKSAGKLHQGAAKLFVHPNSVQHRLGALARRYTTTDPTQNIHSGSGICGQYDSDAQEGVCLWTGGVDPVTSETPGWITGSNDVNCNKQIYVQRKDDPSSVRYVKLLDGCTFLASEAPEEGCFRIGLTIGLFHALNPSGKENTTKAINNLIWDFDNYYGQNKTNAPW